MSPKGMDKRKTGPTSDLERWRLSVILTGTDSMAWWGESLEGTKDRIGGKERPWEARRGRQQVRAALRKSFAIEQSRAESGIFSTCDITCVWLNLIWKKRDNNS